MDKEKKIKTDRSAFTMTCLNFVLYEINLLGFLHLDVEGWETYALHGSGVVLHGVDDTFFVVCGLWDDRGRKRRHLTLKDADGFKPPYDNVLAAMAEHPNFKRNCVIVDQDMNLCLLFRGQEYSGGGI